MMTHPKFRSLLALLLAVLPMQRAAAFSSLYVFGDGICSTTKVQAPNLKSYYYGNRNCNGRVWVEVLAQWQGLAFDNAKNNSYFGHDSSALITNVGSFTAPGDVATALFVVWCNDADVVNFSQVNTPNPHYTDANKPAWTTFINDAVTRQTTAVTNLYNKGVRTIIMPNAVDVTAAPYYSMTAADRAFIRARVIEFNASFETAMAGLVSSKAGLKILRLDTFTFFDQVLAGPANYGLVNPGYDALTHFGTPSLTGPGASYIFWDYLDPTAKFQMYLADLAQKAISPVKVNNITRNGSTTQITVANVPLSLTGSQPSPRTGTIEGSATLQPPWVQDASISLPFSVGGSTTGSFSTTSMASRRFYRVSFPVVWTWP